MTVDPNKPLLRLTVSDPSARIKGAPRNVPKPPFYSRAGQAANFGPRFRQLGAALDRDLTGLELKRDPAALAPERLLVFELRGSIGTFVNAVAPRSDKSCLCGRFGGLAKNFHEVSLRGATFSRRSAISGRGMPPID